MSIIPYVKIIYKFDMKQLTNCKVISRNKSSFVERNFTFLSMLNRFRYNK